ncbi:TIGR03773 family transporter-associated surface protein [Rothia nasimurium]|uniref:TIGR03773 family transporter-associated surface protein n=1 Tax=Rothia nasimurium TaxID=85336 RepID=UPI003BA0EC10
MQLPLRPFSVAALALGLSLGPLAVNPSVATEATQNPEASVTATASPEAAPVTVLRTEHTDAVALGLTDGKLDLFTYADLPGAPRTRLDPATTVFNLEDKGETRVQVPAGFDFLGQEGQTIWLAPQTQIANVIWPGWNTEDIRPGSLAGDSLTLELVGAKTPDGGAVEVFQSSPFGTSRVFSSREKLPALNQPVGAHVHANWAFTALGTYELTFKASATLADGTPVSTEQTYTFVIGPTSSPEVTPAPDASEAAPVETSPAPTTPAPGEPSTNPAEPGAPEGSQPAPTTPAYPEFVNTPAPAPHTPSTPAGPTTEAPSQQSGQQHAAPAAPAPQQQPAQQQVAQAPAGSSAPAQCLATEEIVKTADQAASATQESGTPTANRASFTDLPAKPRFSIVTATNTGSDRATSGHFDFGAVLDGGALSAQVKDDRTSPAIWKQPGALTFILGDAAKTKLPAGMDHIAPAGSEVYLIGATQQANVPWVGWNTQNPALVDQAAGPVTLTLSDLQGPGRLSVFLSGNFGGAGTPVFNGVGDSFSVPLNTHQHGNWVFTAPGVYTAALTWSAKLKDGSTQTATGTLRFEVGDISAAQTPQNGTSQTPDTPAGSTQNQQQGSAPGSVDQATGIVTRPDGSQVRIVGKTADGADCTLTASQLADAQQASARGELAYTGSSAITTLTVGGLVALLAGGLALVAARRRTRGA